MAKSWIDRHTPKLVISLRERYTRKQFGKDLLAGVTVAVIALLGWNTATEVFDGTRTRPLVETIGSKFGSVPSTLPAPHAPPISLELLHEMLPSAFTIAMLCAIESLLSAVVADGLAHRLPPRLTSRPPPNLPRTAPIFHPPPAPSGIL